MNVSLLTPWLADDLCKDHSPYNQFCGKSKFYYRYDLEKKEGCGVVAHKRLTESHVTME